MAKVNIAWDKTPTPEITGQEITIGEKGTAGKAFTLKPEILTFDFNVKGGGKTFVISHVVIKGDKRSDPANLEVVVPLDSKPLPVANLKSTVVNE